MLIASNFPKAIILCFSVFSFIQCQPITPAGISKTEISQEDKDRLIFLKEVEWPKAYREQDTTLLDRILGEEFQLIAANGDWTSKEDELDWIRENASAPDSFYYDIKRLDFLENGTAILCGTGHIFNFPDSTETIYQSSNVLLLRNGDWKAVASHVSGIQLAE